jgi:hypothetical protein
MVTYFAGRFLCTLAVLTSLCCVAQNGKVEPGAALSDPGVSDAVKKAVEAKGYHVSLDDGIALDLWLRDKVPAQAKKDVPGALYPQLAESTLVAVISFPQATTDYRGQAVKAGVYTLRYELIPEDGNHLGVAENRDFLLLIPASADGDPNAVMKFDELVNLSRQVTGSQHPGPMSLVQASGGAAAAVSKDEADHWVFSAGLKLASGETLPFALVVKGTAPQ